MNLDNLDINIKKREVYEYYYMRNVFNTDNWLFGDYQHMVGELGGYSTQFTPVVYDYWRESCWSQERHDGILYKLHDFIDSGKFRLV